MNNLLQALTHMQSSTSRYDFKNSQTLLMKTISFKNDIKPFRLALPAAVLTLASLGVACDDETSKIGSSLTEGDIAISIDTLSFDLKAKSVPNNNYDARTGNLLLGNIDVPEYGKLSCSFVSRLMCATSLDAVPDSLRSPERVDSCKLVLYMSRGDLTGDSLTPQKVTAYNLTQQLPSDITNSFDPTGYYDPSSKLGAKSFTASYAGRVDSIAMSSPSASSSGVLSNSTIAIDIDIPKEFGVKIFEDYEKNPEIFEWPSTFAKYYPGLFVEPSFGKGCVSNIWAVDLTVFYWYNNKVTTIEEKDTTITWEHAPAYVTPLMSAPEVLSSNNIKYEVSDYLKNLVSDGKSVVTTPGGYNVEFKFPAEDILEHYRKDSHNLSLISELILSIPAETIDNDYGIGAPPTLMLIKTSELKNFFTDNKIPDNISSFTAEYDSTNKRYRFSSMRSYIIDLLNKTDISDEDVEFTILPISLTTENNSYNTTVTYITKCTPYTIKPTMVRLDTDEAEVVFTFSSQIID